MKTLIYLLSIVSILLLNSCATPILVAYQANSKDTGTITLKPTDPTGKTFVMMNDILLVDNKNAKYVTITNVPEGEHIVNYRAGSSMYKYELNVTDTINMKNRNHITKIVDVPPVSDAYWIYLGLSGIGSAILWVLIF